MPVLLDDLAGLGDLAVPAAARERSWALVRQEVRAREGRGAHSKAAYWRYALGSAAVVIAAVVGIVTFTGHEAPEVVSNSTSTNATQAPTSTAPGTSITEPGSSTSTSGSPTTTGGTTPGTGASTTGTTPAPGTTSAPGTTRTTADPQLKPPPSPTTARTTETTAPPRSTTTGEPVMTQAQRENSARAVATVLGQEVSEGTPSGASQVLKSSAKPGLTMMVKSMTAPTSPHIAGVSVGDPVTRVILVFVDRVPDGQGGTTTVERRFALDVQILGGEAYITGIFQAAE